MVEIRRILCPSDFSAFARRAFDLSLAVAQRHGAGIRAVHVAPRPLPARARGPLCMTPAALEVEDPRRLLDDLARFVGPASQGRARADAAVLEGDVVEEIVRQAREWPADLVVMGTRGRRGTAGWAVGSVTESVLRGAPCPVLTVSRPAEPRSVATGLFRRILCPFDFSEPSRLALEFALSFARASQGRLTLLHVLEWFPEERPWAHNHFTVPEYRLDLSEAARERLRGAVPEAARGWCEREETVAIGRPHREILRIARQRDVDLIVLGIHGRRAIDRSLFGATVCHVVREAGCPVLAVRLLADGREE